MTSRNFHSKKREARITKIKETVILSRNRYLQIVRTAPQKPQKTPFRLTVVYEM